MVEEKLEEVEEEEVEEGVEAPRADHPVRTQPGEKMDLRSRSPWCSSASLACRCMSRWPSIRETLPWGRWKAAAAPGGALGNSWARVETWGAAAATSVRLAMPIASTLCLQPARSTRSKE